MKHVVIFNDHWCSGGVESLWTNLIKNITTDEFDFTILATQKETDIYDDILNEHNVNIITILDKVISNPIIRTKKNIKGFKNKIKELNPDILHINSCNASGLKLAHIAKKCGIKHVIVHSHNTLIEADKLKLKLLAHKIWQHKYLSAPDAYFGCSTESLEFMFNTKKGYLLKNGVDLSKFKFEEEYRNEIRGKFNLRPDDYVIGHVGRFCNQKNHKFLIDIFNNYLKTNNGYLMLVGEGELREEIEEYVDSLGIKNHIIFAGTTSEVYKYYSAFDLFVLPSLHEGLPVVAIEAQATDLPVIMADTITQEAKITTNVSYLPLSDMDLWVSGINQYKNIERKDTKEEITASGFDIKASASNLIKFYQNM